MVGMNPCRLRSALSQFALILALISRSLSAEPSRFVTTQGKRFVDPNGKPLLLRGINLGNWLVPEGYMFRLDTVNSPRLLHRVVAELLGPDGAQDFWATYEDTYITREDIQLIRRAGFNSVRVPFNFRSFTPEDQPGIWSGRGFELLDRVVGWCQEAKLWVILDLHCAPGGQTGDNIDDSWGYPWLFESPRSQDRTVAVWRKIAERYRSNATVAAYDLLNEPIPHFFDTQKLNPRLEPLYRRIVSAIREVDSHHLIMLEGSQWASKFEVFSPPFDSRLVYSFHKYWTAPTQNVIQEYLDFSERHQVPIYMGESGENSDDWITQFRGTLEQNQVSWCFWPYKKMDATSCLVRIEKPAGFDQVITYAKAPRETFEQIRTARKAAPEAAAALSALLENCRLRNCKSNPGYYQALGMKAP
jgi:aryl-phospho-beta-D-glucosidase BglC (GH1 family)